MESKINRIPNISHAAIAGLVRDESKAEGAIEELQAAGFSDNEIGVAAPHELGKIENFGDRLAEKLGIHESTEQASDLEESLRECGIPEQQVSYLNSELGKGGVLVTTHAGPNRATKALAILQQYGADVGATAPDSEGSKPPEWNTIGRRVLLLARFCAFATSVYRNAYREKVCVKKSVCRMRKNLP